MHNTYHNHLSVDDESVDGNFCSDTLVFLIPRNNLTILNFTR